MAKENFNSVKQQNRARLKVYSKKQKKLEKENLKSYLGGPGSYRFKLNRLIEPVKEFLKEFINDDDNRILSQF